VLSSNVPARKLPELAGSRPNGVVVDPNNLTPFLRMEGPRMRIVDGQFSPTPRRDFLKVSGSSLSAAAVSGLAQAAQTTTEQKLPSIQVGPHRISRLVVGWNPIGGHSHTTWTMAQFMRQYFTLDRVVEFLRKCESEGITAWQFDHTDIGVGAIQRLRELGTNMKFICLHAERAIDAPIKKVIDDTGCIAIVHHGGVTDALFRAGQHQKVHDFVKKVHDHGVLAGVSAHNPDNIKRIADEGWEVDLFMCCFYYVTRPREEQLEKLGKVAVYEPYYESDPDEMTAVMRQVSQPCLGFKILAAGRLAWTQKQVETCFRRAFERIKPTDGVIVGMFPVYFDEVAADAAYTRQYGQIA
jgi:hypothetical protein